MFRLDPSHPLPLYAQLAEAIRYEIARGELAAGALLPPLRAGAQRWGVNLHTVRRAYAELAEKGLVRTEPQRGTVVLGRSAGTVGIDPVEWFVSRMVTEAYDQHGLSLTDLKLRLERWGSRASAGTRGVHVVERGEEEASALAAEIRSRWDVPADGWSLERPGPPPQGLLLASMQQYNEIRVRWPERFGEVRFLGTRPDPTLPSRVVSAASRVVRAVVCERDPAAAASFVADVRRLLPRNRVEVMPHVVARPGELLSFTPDSLDAVLFPPRMWAGLDARERAHPKAIELRYVFESNDLERLATELRWPPR